MNFCRIWLGILLMFAVVQAAAAAEPQRYARFEVGGEIRHGFVEGASLVEISGSPLKSHTRTGAKHAISDVRLLAPILPGKVLAVGLNYASHAGMSGARQPEIFWKASSAIVGPGDAIWYPPGADSVHYEGELVVRI
jgi:2-keto-4-pentenoate hydratase/2-oxohepta-3-ene-1,7-dioic acid hydratase in catechol pathway